MGNKVRYAILILAIIMLIIQFIVSDYNNFFNWKNLLSIISPIFLIIAMYGSIRHVNKYDEN